ncbi:hypothetical protein PG993_014166 [Apiospora rasikravindrae]|uniref:Nephrocystin 3-like N-terminal domain-containing protein n=1 Tax=Apiospora rasikravindrae TaxID=990691 RepID=A0ABR1RTU2_9PEZI
MARHRTLNVAVAGNPPFREYDFNTSQLVRDALPDRVTRENQGDIRIHNVSREIWGGARSLFLPEPLPDEEDESHVDIDFILHMGMIALGSDSTQFRLETVARRDGYKLARDDGKPVDSDQLKRLCLPETLQTSFDVEAAWRKVHQDHPETTCRVSDDAGLYFCEFRLYSSLAEPLLTEAFRAKMGRVLFLHLPQAHSPEAIRLARNIAVGYITSLVDDPILSRMTSSGLYYSCRAGELKERNQGASRGVDVQLYQASALQHASCALKPEVKLGIAISEFSQALDDTYRQRFVALRGGSPRVLDPTEVIRVTEELNREGAKTHRTWRPYSTRLCSFLHRIQIFASIGDVCIGGAQSLIASGVWCAIRVCLESTIGFLTYFDKLSEILMHLGNSWALHQDFAALFPRSNDLQAYTSNYVTAIVHLCRKAVVFSRQPTWKQFTASLTRSFEREFGPLVSELDQWGKLIEHRCYMLATEHLIRADHGAVEHTKALAYSLSSASNEQKRFLLKQAVLRSLLPDQNHFETQWRRQRRKGTCPWLLNHADYKLWERETQSYFLWIEGIIGSGKTVALANIVADASLAQSCAYVFCSSRESRNARDIIGCIAYHFARKVPVDDPLWDQVVSKEDAGLMSVSEIRDLIFTASPVQDKIVIVIDTLEECEQDEIDDVSHFLASLMEQRTVLVCCSCRLESDCQKRVLRVTPSVQQLHILLNNDLRAGEIEHFIDAEIERKTAGKDLDQDLKGFIKAQLIAGAQGMYLWVSLQLEALFPERPGTATNVDYIRNILCHLPASLPEAFDQALSRITTKRYGSNPFKLVTAAESPLTLDEFRVALTVVPGNTKWDGSKLPSDAKALVYDCGGNLLEVDEEHQTVHFIHHSAMVHLVSASSRDDTRSLHFELQEAELYVGAICVTLLHYEIFDQRVSRKPQAISGKHTAQKIINSSFANSQLWSRVARHIGPRSKGKPVTDIDIGTVLYGMMASTPDSNVVTYLLPYASTNWLKHTSMLTPGMSDIWAMWSAILQGRLEHIELPWDSTTTGGLLDWAFDHVHNALILYVLRKEPMSRNDFLPVYQIKRRVTWQTKTNSVWLNDILARAIHEFRDSLVIAPLQVLLDIGADPDAPHRALNKRPLEMIVDLLPGCHHLQYSSVLCNFLGHSSVRYYMRGFPPIESRVWNKTALGWALELQPEITTLRMLYWTEKNEPKVFSAMKLNGSYGLLYSAVVYRRPEIIRLLLEQSFNPHVEQAIRVDTDSQTNESPITAAIRLSYISELEVFINHGPDITHRPALGYIAGALRQGDDQLMVAGLEPDRTPLVLDHQKRVSVALLVGRHLCLYPVGHASGPEKALPLAIFTSLLKRRWTPSDLERLDHRGNALLHYAVRCQECVEDILRLGANPNICSDAGETPLFQAMLAYTTNPSSALLQSTALPLLEHGASPSLSVLHDTSAMRLAVLCESTEALELLLRFGGDPNEYLPPMTTADSQVREPEGYTLLDIAVETENRAAAELLMKHGSLDERPSTLREEAKIQ